MKLTKTQRLILFSLGQFYDQLNQPLKEKPLQLQTSKIVFITFLLHSGIITKQERALYRNLESLEEKNLITYEKRMIKLTPQGISILQKINDEIRKFNEIEKFFAKKKTTTKQKLQTMIKN